MCELFRCIDLPHYDSWNDALSERTQNNPSNSTQVRKSTDVGPYRARLPPARPALNRRKPFHHIESLWRVSIDIICLLACKIKTTIYVHEKNIKQVRSSFSTRLYTGFLLHINAIFTWLLLYGYID
jgi:hypothetical protein